MGRTKIKLAPPARSNINNIKLKKFLMLIYKNSIVSKNEIPLVFENTNNMRAYLKTLVRELERASTTGAKAFIRRADKVMSTAKSSKIELSWIDLIYEQKERN